MARLPERFGPGTAYGNALTGSARPAFSKLFFDALASMSLSAHLIQMFDSTIVRAHVSAAGAKGGKKARRLDAARRLHHENPREIDASGDIIAFDLTGGEA